MPLNRGAALHLACKCSVCLFNHSLAVFCTLPYVPVTKQSAVAVQLAFLSHISGMEGSSGSSAVPLHPHALILPLSSPAHSPFPCSWMASLLHVVLLITATPSHSSAHKRTCRAASDSLLPLLSYLDQSQTALVLTQLILMQMYLLWLAEGS